MQLFDTHCHIHEADFPLPIAEVEERAKSAGVTRLLCVGTTVQSSREAVAFAAGRDMCWASIGLHPHDAKLGNDALTQLRGLLEPQLAPKIVAIGECGLDYFYSHSPKVDQEKAFRFQIELALEYKLPLIFHVREAFDDFWPIFDSYKNIRGVIHSFTDTQENLDKLLARGLYVGVNGIMTFTKNDWQLDVARQIPKDRLLLETDAPFLTPHPHRGRVNEPANVRLVAEFLAQLRKEPIAEIADNTTHNALKLFLN